MNRESFKMLFSRAWAHLVAMVREWIERRLTSPQPPSPAETWARVLQERWNFDGSIVPDAIKVLVPAEHGRCTVVWPGLQWARALSSSIAAFRLKVVVGHQTASTLVDAAEVIESHIAWLFGGVSIIGCERATDDPNAVDFTIGRLPSIADVVPQPGWDCLAPASPLIYLGVDASANSVFLDPRERPGVIVSGEPGSGKTLLMLRIAAELIRGGATGIVIDMKGAGDFGDLARAVEVIEDDLDAALDAVQRVAQYMQERQAWLRENGFRDFWSTGNALPLFLVIDEVQELLATDGVDTGRRRKAETIRTTLTSIAKRGRSAGVFLVLGSQKLTADALPTGLRDALTLRISGSQPTAEAARAALGELRDGEARPDLLPVRRPGVMVLAGQGPHNLVFQAPPLSDDALLSILDAGPEAQAA